MLNQIKETRFTYKLFFLSMFKYQMQSAHEMFVLFENIINNYPHVFEDRK